MQEPLNKQDNQRLSPMALSYNTLIPKSKTTNDIESLVRQSYQAGFFLNASAIRQDDDYFACDDSVIRSPTYYTRTARDEDRFVFGRGENFGG